MSARDKHMRECYVVCEEGADKSKIESDIKNMPDYFAPYDTKMCIRDRGKGSEPGAF